MRCEPCPAGGFCAAAAATSEALAFTPCPTGSYNPVTGAPSAEACLDLLKRGAQNLKFAATAMNRHSSRSHAICQLFVKGTPVKSPHKSPARAVVLGRLREPTTRS